MRRQNHVVRWVLHSLGASAVALFAFACATPASEDVGGGQDAVKGSIASTRACAVRDAYQAATLQDLTLIGAPDLPPDARTKVGEVVATGLELETLARFDVPGVGRAFVAEYQASNHSFDGGSPLALPETMLQFFDPAGHLVVVGEWRGRESGFVQITSTGPAELVCDGDVATWDGGGVLADAGPGDS